jgi:hypothetical protein
MKLRPPETLANFVLVLGCVGFVPIGAWAQALTQERTLLAAVSDAAHWKATDPRVAKANQNLAD